MHTVRLIGEQIPKGAGRGGCPVSSSYEERKAREKKRHTSDRWADIFASSGMTLDEVKEMARTTDKEVRGLEKEVKTFRQTVAADQASQTNASSMVRRGKPGSYQELYLARKKLRASRSELAPKEQELRSLRRRSYYWNKMSKATGAPKSKKNDVKKDNQVVCSIANWSHVTVEDDPYHIDVQHLLDESDENHHVGWAGTDYGVCFMSRTVALTHSELKAYINQYNILESKSN